MSTAKSNVSDMLASIKLNNKNYDSWYKKIKYRLDENGTLDFITREVKSQVSNVVANVKRYAKEVQKCKSAQFLIMSCMSDEIVHMFEDMKLVKAIWMP